MKKRIGRRLVSLLLTFVTVLTMLPAMTLPALAVESGTLNLTDMSIGLSFDGDADNAWSAGGETIRGSAAGGKGAIFPYSTNSTLTIKNNKNTKAILSFDYTIKKSSWGKIQVDRTNVTAGGTFSKELGQGGSITVHLDSGIGADQYAKIEITNVKLVYVVGATVTFQPAKNGSYTVDGNTITELYEKTQSSTIAYNVDATPAKGYQFMDWYDVNNNKSISRYKKAELNIENDCTITARFTTSGLALFETGGLVYDDLTNAITAASGKPSALITQVGDGTISGSYTIPSGVTLLIPFDEAGTLYRETPTATRETPATKPFRTLTMAAGSSITLENGAALSVGGQYYAGGGGQSGKMVGPYGYIKMESGSAISVNSGANLYAWGFISGSGAVTVESGGTVYEWYQILDFRGGFATTNIVTFGTHKVFPLSQYTVQNVEVPLTLCAGASETVYAAVFADDVIHLTPVQFIGNNGMFKLNSDSLTKTYDGSTDRLIYTINGDAEVNSLSLSLAGTELASSKYVLPFTSNMTVVLKSGSRLTMNQTAALLPGVETTIEKGAELVVPTGKSMYIYDVEQWGKYCFNGSYVESVSVPYAPGKTGTRASLTDAKVDINGTLTAIGSIYTTKSGANICSSEGSGKFVQKNEPGTETTTYQVTKQASKKSPLTDYAKIPITPAQLKNAAGDPTPTAGSVANDTFTYCTCPTCGGKWGKNLQVAAIINGNGEQVKTCATLQAAVNEYTPTSSTAPTNYIKLLHNTTEKTISVSNKSLYLDLNGRTVKGDISVTNGYKLYGMDSSTGKDYVTAPSGKIVGKVTGTVAPVFEKPLTGDAEYNYLRYVAIKNEEGTEYTFHRFNISVTGYRFELAAPECALFFIGKFQGDDAAKNHLTELGFTLMKDGNDTLLGTDSYTIPKDTKIPDESKPGQSPVVLAKDGAFLFEVHLKRSFEKNPVDTASEEFSAIAQAKFDNGGKQESKPQMLSFKKAWKDALKGPGMNQKDREILTKFLNDNNLNISNP